MPSSGKTSIGLNLWAGTDTPQREDFNSDNTIITEKMLSISAVNVTMPAAWGPGAGGSPYFLAVDVPGMTVGAIALFDIQNDATEEQLAAFEAARIIAYSQSTDEITFRAWGDAPTASIPITIVIVG